MVKTEQKSTTDQLLEVRILTLGQTIWSGQAKTVSAGNVSGGFDVLPGHVNFISVLTDKPIKIKTADGQVEEFSLSRSVMYVKADKVIIYAEV